MVDQQAFTQYVAFTKPKASMLNTCPLRPLAPLQVALTAVSSALSLTAAIMDDQQAIEQYVAATKPKTGMPNMMEALHLQETAAAIQQQGSEADGRCEVHTVVE